MESIIYNDDCFNKFASIPDKSVQLVCVDLPYNQTACKWDSLIDLDKMWIELKRIGRENCQYVFFCTTKFGYKLISSNEKWFRSDIVWKKSNKTIGFYNCNKAVLRNHEMIYLFHNDKKQKGLEWCYNPQMTIDEPYTTTKGIKMRNTGVYGKATLRTPKVNKSERFPKSIIDFKVDGLNQYTKPLHPTQKPVELCEWLIKTYSNEGDMVLDFTMGSGSTIIACINTNRRYIGIEKDKDIFLTAKKRIQERNELIKTNKDLVIN